jgi:hypothetical protein
MIAEKLKKADDRINSEESRFKVINSGTDPDGHRTYDSVHWD